MHFAAVIFYFKFYQFTSANKMSVLIVLREEKKVTLGFSYWTQKNQFLQVILPTNEEVSTELLKTLNEIMFSCISVKELYMLYIQF